MSFLMLFLRTASEMPGKYLRLGHDRFLPCPFHFYLSVVIPLFGAV